MQLLVLASYERGLFTYYPVLAVGLATGLWTRRTRMATYWLSGLLAAFVTLYGFWFKWFLGGEMGHRGFVELMPFAAVIFASALPELKSRYRVAAIVLGTGGGTPRLFWNHIVGKNSLLILPEARARAAPG